MARETCRRPSAGTTGCVAGTSASEEARGGDCGGESGCVGGTGDDIDCDSAEGVAPAELCSAFDDESGAGDSEAAGPAAAAVLVAPLEGAASAADLAALDGAAAAADAECDAAAALAGAALALAAAAGALASAAREEEAAAAGRRSRAGEAERRERPLDDRGGDARRDEPEAEAEAGARDELGGGDGRRCENELGPRAEEEEEEEASGGGERPRVWCAGCCQCAPVTHSDQ